MFFVVLFSQILGENLFIFFCSFQMLRAYDDSVFIRAAAESKLLVILETFSYVGLSVDAMAQFWNKKFELYFSRLKDPSAIGQNFFAQKLSPGVGYYIFPPPWDIVAALLHFRSFQAYGVILLPLWPGSPYQLCLS